MMLKLKVFLAKILNSKFNGWIIGKIFNNRIPFHQTYIYTNSPQISSNVKASLFWKTYESSEVRFIKKYLPDSNDVIELGGSIGVVATQIGKKIKSKKLVTVEANPLLKPIIENNLTKNDIQNFKVLNGVVCSEKEEQWFDFGNGNLFGKISSQKPAKGELIKPLKLADIIQDNNISEFNLICDIEGAEADLILNESESLKKCQWIIIETHKTIYKNQSYDTSFFKEALAKLGFDLIDSHGPVLVLKRKR